MCVNKCGNRTLFVLHCEQLTFHTYALYIIDFNNFRLIFHWEIRLNMKRIRRRRRREQKKNIEICSMRYWSLMYLYAAVITGNDEQTTYVLRATTTNATRFYALFTPSATFNRVTLK